MELREAAQMALDALTYIYTETTADEDKLIHASIESLRAALAQPPCATGAQCVGGKCERCAVQEWQGLTEEEITRLRHLYDPTAHWSLVAFARAIEAKLREKNFDRPS